MVKEIDEKAVLEFDSQYQILKPKGKVNTKKLCKVIELIQNPKDENNFSYFHAFWNYFDEKYRIQLDENCELANLLEKDCENCYTVNNRNIYEFYITYQLTLLLNQEKLKSIISNSRIEDKDIGIYFSFSYSQLEKNQEFDFIAFFKEYVFRKFGQKIIIGKNRDNIISNTEQDMLKERELFVSDSINTIEKIKFLAEESLDKKKIENDLLLKVTDFIEEIQNRNNAIYQQLQDLKTSIGHHDSYYIGKSIIRIMNDIQSVLEYHNKIKEIYQIESNSLYQEYSKLHSALCMVFARLEHLLNIFGIKKITEAQLKKANALEEGYFEISNETEFAIDDLWVIDEVITQGYILENQLENIDEVIQPAKIKVKRRV